METKVIPCQRKIQGTISAISSKSHLHRVIICACLSDKGCKITYHSKLSKDILATISCLSALGAKIEVTDDVIEIVKTIDKDNIPSDIVLDCNESGSTARFMLPIAALLCKNRATLIGSGKLPVRPFKPLCETLKKMGARFSSTNIPITIERTANPKDYFDICGNISSQYITGLLFILPLCKACGIKLTTELESTGYVNLTSDAMENFGVNVVFKDGIYTTIGTYKSPDAIIKAQGDWSNAAFFLCGATEKNITVDGLDLTSSQPDRALCKILEQMGMEVTYGKDSVTVNTKNGTHGINLDAREIPDLVPIVATRAAVSTGETIISGIERLRIKESDRVKSVCKLINDLGGSSSYDESHIYIKGIPSLQGGKVDSYNDHRIAMSAAIAATFCENDVIISDSQAVSKSYPDFYVHLDMLSKE